jgi:beta-glucosidase
MLISSDPRSHFDSVLGVSVAANGFTRWPGPLGLASTGDPELVRRFADMARQEYRSVGIHMALSPQADLATEPRWPRISGTFGDDPALVSRMVRAYVVGFQDGETGIGPDSVATIVKHWVGYGASAHGFDGHNYYGRFATFPADRLDDHIRPFDAAFQVGVAGIMPTYDVLLGVKLDVQPLEAVGASFNHQLLTDLLRREHGFSGLILSDWAITKDCGPSCMTDAPPQTTADIAMPWGVEALSKVERFAKGVNARSGKDSRCEGISASGFRRTAPIVGAARKRRKRIAPARASAQGLRAWNVTKRSERLRIDRSKEPVAGRCSDTAHRSAS